MGNPTPEDYNWVWDSAMGLSRPKVLMLFPCQKKKERPFFRFLSPRSDRNPFTISTPPIRSDPSSLHKWRRSIPTPTLTPPNPSQPTSHSPSTSTSHPPLSTPLPSCRSPPPSPEPSSSTPDNSPSTPSPTHRPTPPCPSPSHLLTQPLVPDSPSPLRMPPPPSSLLTQPPLPPPPSSGFPLRRQPWESPLLSTHSARQYTPEPSSPVRTPPPQGFATLLASTSPLASPP